MWNMDSSLADANFGSLHKNNFFCILRNRLDAYLQNNGGGRHAFQIINQIKAY